MNLQDTIGERIGEMRVDAYDSDDIQTRKLLWSEYIGRNLVTNNGKSYFLDAADGAAARTLINSQGALLIGTGTTAAAVGDTQLGSVLYRAPLDAGFPTRSGVVSTYQFTIATTVTAAAGQHTEFGLTNASTTGLTDGVLITHLVKSGGFQKDSTVALVYTYTLTQS